LCINNHIVPFKETEVVFTRCYFRFAKAVIADVLYTYVRHCLTA